MQVKLLVEGGNMQPGPSLSQKIGPLGINIGKVIQRVNDATKNFPGLKVPVELDINTKTKDFEIKIFSPPVSELLKKELGIEKGSGTQHKLYAANASIEQIISIAKTKLPNLLCKDLKSAVKTVIGTCASLGILVENQLSAELGHQIAGGKFSKEIEEERTETSPEKRAELDQYFEEIKGKQEQVIKQEEAEKAAAEVGTSEEKPEEEKPEEEETEKKT
ncbi:MAG TPA: 50S ribosomal protein L11 [Candidatus Pacearchaeota archaeon]|nr:50S ribosomal protein L11 [Candidatus Pacearchaeota archaeon]